jgi:hypothetical protein
MVADSVPFEETFVVAGGDHRDVGQFDGGEDLPGLAGMLDPDSPGSPGPVAEDADVAAGIDRGKLYPPFGQDRDGAVDGVTFGDAT